MPQLFTSFNLERVELCKELHTEWTYSFPPGGSAGCEGGDPLRPGVELLPFDELLLRSEEVVRVGETFEGVGFILALTHEKPSGLIKAIAYRQSDLTTMMIGVHELVPASRFDFEDALAAFRSSACVA